jgi:hypothetical protein
MTKLAIDATYVDYRRVKGRKVHQIIFEVPSELWPEAYRVLGEPTIETSDWFGIAKMTGAAPQQNKGGKLAQRAGILCSEGAFQRFARECGYDDAVKMVYARCDVTSRAHLDHDDGAAKAFHELDLEYQAWMRTS